MFIAISLKQDQSSSGAACWERDLILPGQKHTAHQTEHHDALGTRRKVFAISVRHTAPNGANAMCWRQSIAMARLWRLEHESCGLIPQFLRTGKGPPCGRRGRSSPDRE
jgi:hypothetical protein